MRRSNIPTLQDVAREAGVHVMAVSVVLNGARSSARVSDATRARIMEVAARLRYRPNAVARGLLHGRMNMVGVVAVVDGGSMNTYFHEMLNGILEMATNHCQNTCVLSVPSWDQAESRILQFCDGRIDGMILLAPRYVAPELVETVRRHVPFVTIHSNVVLHQILDIEADDEAGGYAAVRYLIEQGHRRIAHFPGGLELTGPQQRLTGYRRALAEAGIAYDDALVLRGGFSVWSGRERMNELLERGRSEPLPTAIFCGSDAIAFGCMEVLANLGLRVPDAISIVGFDDTLTASMTAPPLTTVRQPLRQMGRYAMEQVLLQIGSGAEGDTPAALSSPTSSEVYRQVFPVELVIRGSVSAPPACPVVVPTL